MLEFGWPYGSGLVLLLLDFIFVYDGDVKVGKGCFEIAELHPVVLDFCWILIYWSIRIILLV